MVKYETVELLSWLQAFEIVYNILLGFFTTALAPVRWFFLSNLKWREPEVDTSQKTAVIALFGFFWFRLGLSLNMLFCL